MSKVIDCEQYSELWWLFRNGKPSASNAKKLVTSTGLPSKQLKDYAIELANALFAGHEVDQWEGNSATQRGTELESQARMAYEFLTESDVVEVGSYTDDDEQYIASPDGVIGDRLLEIKNLSGKNHTKALLYHAKHKKAPPDYIPQCQMAMHVSGLDKLDLVFHHPELPLLVIPMTPDEKVINCLACQLTECLKERDNTLKILESL